MKTAIQLILGVAILALGYFVYDSINSKILFEKEANRRKDIVVERLKDIRTAQMSYKSVNGHFASDFKTILSFVKEGRFPIIKQIGDAEDSLAVAQGKVIRDTLFIAVKDTLFTPSSLGPRLIPFHIDSLPYVPFSHGEQFSIAAGEIEKNKVNVQVFEVMAKYSQIFRGMDVSGENVKMNEGLKVGSMTEPSTNGNWE